MVLYHRWGNDASGTLERCVIVLNFSAYDQVVTVPFSVNGPWEERLGGAQVTIRDFRLENYRVYSHWGCVFHKRD